MIHQKSGQINIILHDQPFDDRDSPTSIQTKNGPFTHIDQFFTEFIGLEKLKNAIKEIYATKMVNEKRKQIGLSCKPQVLHMLFTGNPGTGKTTVARKLAQFYGEHNLLSKGHFIEAERADLVGEYIGQTAQKTRSMLEKARGGILFIDEAYSLARGGEKDFGKEAIDTLVTHMENHHQDFVLILAGYPEEMRHFLSLNPGLKSRFPFQIEFPDFTVQELMMIAKQMVAKREYQLTKDAEQQLKAFLTFEKRKAVKHFANGRYVRNIIEEAIRRHALRVCSYEALSAEVLMYLMVEDFKFQ